MSAVQLDGILNAISGIPDLERGLCVGNWETFDQEDDPGVTEDRGRVVPPLPGARGLWELGRQPATPATATGYNRRSGAVFGQATPEGNGIVSEKPLPKAISWLPDPNGSRGRRTQRHGRV